MLLAGHKKNAYWYGSQLSIEEARKHQVDGAVALQDAAKLLKAIGTGSGTLTLVPWPAP